MNQGSSIQIAAAAVRKIWETHGIQQPFRFIGFCLSLLPVPVIQQVGQALDRHLSDKAFQREVEDLWSCIDDLNPLAGQVATLEAAIQEIAKTVAADPEVSARVRKFLSKLGGQANEFKVITEGNSYQEIVGSVIIADLAVFSADSGSTNVLSGTVVNSGNTTLIARNGSRNRVDNARFAGDAGNLFMQKLATNGRIDVAGSSVGFGIGGSIEFGVGGSLMFGSSQLDITATCPKCNARITADKRELLGYASVQCPSCNAVLPFNPSTIR
jgi:hypothetical protein